MEGRPGFVIERLTARLSQQKPGTDERPARQVWLNTLLGGCDLAPHGMPPSATLVVRRLADPLPGRIARSLHDVRAEPAWEQAVRGRLADLWRQAARPERGMLPPDSEAVLFVDGAELTACFALDVAAGQAPARWWWQMLLPGLGGLGGGLRAVLARQPEYLPAVFAYLVDWGCERAVLGALSPSDSVALAVAVAAAFGLPDLRAGAVGPVAPGAVPGGVPGEAPGPRPGADALGPEIARLIEGLAPEQRLLLELALILVRGTGAESVWWAGVVWPQNSGSLGTAQNFTGSLGTARDFSGPLGTARDFTGPLGTAQNFTGPLGTAQNFTGPLGTARDFTGPLGTAQNFAGPLGTARDFSGPLGASRDFTGPLGTAQDFMGPLGTARDFSGPLESTSGSLEDPQLDPVPAPEPAPGPALPPVWPLEGLPTRLGGLLYLINLMRHLGLPGTCHSEIGPWALLEALGRALVPSLERAPWPDLTGDPVWAALATLDGREPRTPPGAGLAFPVPARLPDAWPLAPEPLSPADLSQTLAADLDPGLAAWLSLAVPYLRYRLQQAMQMDDPIAHLLLVPGRLHITATHLDLTVAIERTSVAVRMAGLDRNPGWLAAFRRVIQFHFT
jgi:hypothetical protein